MFNVLETTVVLICLLSALTCAVSCLFMVVFRKKPNNVFYTFNSFGEEKEQIKEVTMADIEEKFGEKIKIVSDLKE